MKNLFLVFAAVVVFFSCAPENDPGGSEGQEPVNNNPKELIVTGEASDIDYISVTLSGYANIPEGTSGMTFGVLLSVNENPTVDNGMIIQARELDGNNKFHCTVDNLLIGTKYYYKAYLKDGDYYRTGSKTLSFTTKDFTDESIVTEEASKIGYNSATLKGTTNLPTSFAMELFGIILSKEEDPTVKNGTVIQSHNWDGDYSFSCDVTELSIATTYYYRAYFKYKGDYRMGKTMSFTTKDFADDWIVTAEATEIGFFSAVLNGTVNNPSGLTGGSFGFILSKNADPTVDNGWVIQNMELDGSNKFSYEATELSIATTYYYRAYFKYEGEYRMGKTRSFTTMDFADDLIITAEATEIDYFSAVFNGTVNIPSDFNGWYRFGFIYFSADPTENDKEIEVEKLDGSNKFSYKAANLSYGTTYFYRAYFKTGDPDIKYRMGRVRSFTTKSGLEAVDLGLSVKWGSCNIGASTPLSHGDYYAWGETETKDKYSWDNYKWGKANNQLTKYCTSRFYGYSGFTDGKTVLDPEDDVAHEKHGGKWRMPTSAEWTELREKCSWKRTTMDGVSGWKVTGRNGSSIFLPAEGYKDGSGVALGTENGYYWSSEINNGHPYEAIDIFFSSYVTDNVCNRSTGLPVRPVSE